MQFEIIDLITGKYPDIYNIALKEEWAKDLKCGYVDGFFIGENGELILADKCGNCVDCPHDRFEIRIDSDTKEQPPFSFIY